MRLPDDFPHARHEQYLMVLPPELLQSSEAATKQLLTIRFRYYLRTLVLPLVEEAASRGLTVREWAEEYVATLHGRLPRVFER